MLESSSSLFVEAPALGVLIPRFPGLPPGGVTVFPGLPPGGVPAPGWRLTPDEGEGLPQPPAGVGVGWPPDGNGVDVLGLGVLLRVEEEVVWSVTFP